VEENAWNRERAFASYLAARRVLTTLLLMDNKANAGGSVIEAGLRHVPIREVGLIKNVQDIENSVITTNSGTPLRVREIALVSQRPKIPARQFARAIDREGGVQRRRSKLLSRSLIDEPAAEGLANLYLARW
jgi:multidrug efflux pump subunit AcrB